ncbi:hypothetical protein OS493_026155 [Desmophyllum pertusum]|uniref:Uncharacterized protein n=1 Tax=Desmophyllum pertusum TaxID=174260 RepID=A0A9W9ZZL1_9CNID|nr:hypothetical protein OS493_026155 [Desmophyllum pertusum]
MVKAVKKQEVKGMLIDRLMAVYYERQDKLGSLLTAREFSVQKKVSVIFVQELKGFVDCLAVLRPAIDTAVEDITSTYKRKPQKVPQNDFLLGYDSPWMITTLYILSGVLALLVLSGLLWDFIDKKRVRKTEQDLEAVKTCEIEMDVNVLSRDIDEGQEILVQLKDYITRLQRKTQEKHKRDLKTWE